MKHQNDIKDTYNVKAATVLGFAHIICGVISGFCGINEIDVVNHEYSVSTIGAGVWSSMFFFTSGGLAIVGAQSGKKGLVVATMVMAIISAVCAGVLLITSALSARNQLFTSYDDNDHHNHLQTSQVLDDRNKSLLASYSLLIIAGATMLIVAIISASLTCQPLCCRSTDQEMVHQVDDQPQQINNHVNQVDQVHYNTNFSPFYPSLKISHKMVTLPKLLNFCGCASLKTGTMVIGLLNLGVSVIGTLASIDYLADLKDWPSTYWSSSSSSLSNHNHNFSQTGHFFKWC